MKAAISRLSAGCPLSAEICAGREDISCQLSSCLPRFEFRLTHSSCFQGICTGLLVSRLDEIAPALKAVFRELEIFQILHLCLGVVLALEHGNHTRGPVGPHIVADDRVGNVQLVVNQKSSIPPASNHAGCAAAVQTLSHAAIAEA